MTLIEINAARPARRRRRSPRAPTGHQRELRRIDEQLAASGADDHVRAGLLVERATVSGAPDDLAAAVDAVDADVRRRPDRSELVLLRAQLDVEERRPGRVAGRLEGAGLARGADQLAVLGDAEAQLGHREHAEQDYREALAVGPSLRAKLGLAGLAAEAGDHTGADIRYGDLETGLPTTSHALAEVRARRALVASAAGAPDTAWRHVQSARAACGGCWVVAAAAACVLRRVRRHDTAVGWLALAIGTAPRPELMTELADLLLVRGSTEAARRWRAMALAAYLASAGRGEAVHLRHLAEYYADVAGDQRTAAMWAERALAAAHEPYGG